MNLWPHRGRDLSPLAATACLVFVAAVVTLLRWRFVDVPLERDEGEYAYFGQVILRGGLPYRDAYNMKPPGIYYAHALVLWLYGETIRGVRLAVATVALVNLWLFYRCARHWFSRFPAMAGSAAFGLLALSHRMLGFAAKAEHYVLLFGLAGLVLGFAAARRGSPFRWLMAGVACGMGSTMKPTGAVFAAYLVWRIVARGEGQNFRSSARALLSLASGFALPWAVVFGGFWAASAFDAFWFWTVTYAREYATGVPFAEGLKLAQAATAHVFVGAPLVWSLAMLGWFLLAAFGRATGRSRGLWSFLLLSLGSVALGWRFSEHYFLLLVPAAALGVAAVAERLRPWPWVGALIVGGAVAVTAAQEWMTFRGSTPRMVSRAIYGRNPFPEALEIAERVRNASRPEDSIAVVGSEPEIYFYAGRKAATGFVYTYPLTEPHPFAEQMQEQMIREIEAAHPTFLILVHVPTSWSRRVDSPLRIFEWSANYANTKYRPYGLVEISANGHSRSFWGDQAPFRHPESDIFVSVFERNP